MVKTFKGEMKIMSSLENTVNQVLEKFNEFGICKLTPISESIVDQDEGTLSVKIKVEGEMPCSLEHFNSLLMEYMTSGLPSIDEENSDVLRNEYWLVFSLNPMITLTAMGSEH